MVITFITLALTASFAFASADNQTLPNTLQNDRQYAFEWRRQAALTISGDSPMEFETEDTWDYLVTVLSAKGDSVTLAITLNRHRGRFTFSAFGKPGPLREFDSATSGVAVEDSRMSQFVGKAVKLKLKVDQQVLAPDQSDSAASEARRFLAVLLNQERTVIKERTLLGTITLECVGDKPTSDGTQVVRRCSTGAVEEQESVSESRTSILAMVLQALGPPTLDEATVTGQRTSATGNLFPHQLRLNTVVRHVLGRGTAQEYVAVDKIDDVITQTSD